MTKMKAALTGFINAHAENFYSTLESYAKLGYRAFEGGNLLFRSGDPAENLNKVKSFGMEPLAVTYEIKTDLSTSELVKRARTIDVNQVICYMGAAGAHRFGLRAHAPSYEEIMREIEILETMAKELASEGITFLYHNHDVEFNTVFHGVPAIYLMAANSEYLRFEIDCGWVAYAGLDPVRVLKNFGKRLCAIHIKDFTSGSIERSNENGTHIMPRFSTPGTGLLDLAGCLEAAQNLGINWAIVEQDFQYNLTCSETLAAAYLNMKETGFVE